MSFTTPFDPYQAGDLFYGLAKERDALMAHLGVPKDHASGARINSYDIGDIADKTQPRPAENDEFRRWLGAHKKYGNVVGVAKYEWRHWRRKSKGGIEWATKILNPPKRVHFCLDKMTDPSIMLAIVQKTWADDTPERLPFDLKIRAITNAELRWIYRHRQDDGVKKNVQFWENSTQCGPPWERSGLDVIWQSYAPSV